MSGGNGVLFAVWGKKFSTYIVNTKTMTKREIAGFWRRVAYVPTGHIIGADNGGELRAVKLASAGSPVNASASPTQAAGNAVTVAKGVDVGALNGDARFDVSQSGTLAYVRQESGRRSLVIVDRSGQATRVPTPDGDLGSVRLSPDGRHVAVLSPALSIIDLDRGTTTPLVPELDASRGARTWPVWSLNGQSLTFASNHDGNWDIYSKPATGAGAMAPVLTRPMDQTPQSYAPDGTLLFTNIDRQKGTELWLLPPGPPGTEARLWLSNNAVNLNARFSPDGHLVAYSSDSSGRFEVYVQSRDNMAERAQVSAAGGTMPVWSRAGDRLYFRQGNVIMEAAIRATGGLSSGAPVRLFDGGWTLAQQHLFDVMPDGQHFLMVQQPRESIPTRIDVVLNWFTTLKQAVAGSR
jgi:dipeptidyl aminopeptidase/acylaminoacyl peptidase